MIYQKNNLFNIETRELLPVYLKWLANNGFTSLNLKL